MDWNNDGRIDAMDFQMYNEITGGNETNNTSGKSYPGRGKQQVTSLSDLGFAGKLIIGLIVFQILSRIAEIIY